MKLILLVLVEPIAQKATSFSSTDPINRVRTLAPGDGDDTAAFEKG